MIEIIVEKFFQRFNDISTFLLDKFDISAFQNLNFLI